MLAGLLTGLAEGKGNSLKRIRDLENEEKKEQMKRMFDYQKTLEQREYTEKKEAKAKADKIYEITEDEKKFLSSYPNRRSIFNDAKDALEKAIETGAIYDNKDYFSILSNGQRLENLIPNDKRRIAKQRFERILGAEFIPTIIAADELGETDANTKYFRDKLKIGELSPGEWREYIGKAQERLDNKAKNIYEKAKRLSPEQLMEFEKDPLFAGIRSEKDLKELDSALKKVPDEQLTPGLAKMGVKPIDQEFLNPEMKRELIKGGYQILQTGNSTIASVALAAGVTAAASGVGLPVAGAAILVAGASALGDLYGEYATNVAKRTLEGDDDAFLNAYDDLNVKSGIAFELGSRSLFPALRLVKLFLKGGGKLIMEGVNAAIGRSPQYTGKTTKEIIKSGYDPAMEGVENISKKEIMKSLKELKTTAPTETAKETIEAINKNFKEKEFTAKQLENEISRLKGHKKNTAIYVGKDKNIKGDIEAVKETASHLEKIFLPKRAIVSDFQGKLSGAKAAMERKEYNTVAELFSKMPESLVTKEGTVSRDALLLEFLRENSAVLRGINKEKDQSFSKELVNLASGTVGIPIRFLMPVLHKLGIESLKNKELAALFAKGANARFDKAFERDLQKALRGQIVIERQDEIAIALKGFSMGAGASALLRGAFNSPDATGEY